MTTENRKLQIPVEVDATGAKQGFDEVKQGARDMAQAVGQAGDVAGKGLDKVAEGATAAAAKVENASRRISDGIKKSIPGAPGGPQLPDAAPTFEKLTQAQERFLASLEKQGVIASSGKAAYLELRAAQLGVGDAAAASIAKIRAAEQGQVQLGNSAKQTAAALRQVPAQFTDIVTALQAGQAPLTVLLQQGGQLKDTFGGIGPAAQALGGYVAGLVNPFTVAAAAAAALGAAFLVGSRELRGFQDALTLNGNAAGLSVSQFAALRDSLAGIAGTKGKAAEVLTEIAANGQIAAENVESIARAAILMEKATGQAVSATVAQFAELSRSPAESAAKLNEKYNVLTAAVYQQIKALEEQGRRQEAARLAEQTYADTMGERAQIVIQNAGALEKAWRGVTGFAKAAWDAMLGVGRDLSVGEQVAAAAGQVAQLRARLAGFGNVEVTGQASAGRLLQKRQLEDQLQAAEQALKAAQAAAQQEAKVTAEKAEQTRLQRLGIDFIRRGEEFATKAQKRQEELNRAEREGRELVRAGLITEIQLRERLNNIREKYKESGAAGTGQNEVAAIRARVLAEEAELQRLRTKGIDALPQTEGERLVLKIQEELKTSISGVARAEKEKALVEAQALASVQALRQAEEARQKGLKDFEATLSRQVDAENRAADAIEQRAKEQRAIYETLGLNKTAVEQLTLAQMQANFAEQEASDGRFAEAYVANTRRKVQAQREYVEWLQKTEAKQAQLRLAEGGRVAAEEAETLRLEISLLGVSQVEREKIIAQRRVEVKLAKELADIEKLNLGAGPEAEAEREKLRQQARANAVVEAQNAAQRAMLDEWQRTTDEINRSLTDALLRGFESGKGFAENFRDTLRNMFNTLVLRPIISAALSPVSMAVNGAVNGGMNALGLASGASSAYNIGSKAAGYFGLTGGSSAGTGAVFLGTAAEAQAAGLSSTVLSKAALDGTTVFGANSVAGAGAATVANPLLTVAPYAAIAAVVLAALLKEGGGPKVDGQAGVFGGENTLGGQIAREQFGANRLGASLLPAVQGLDAQYQQLARQFGGAAALQFGLAISRDPEGTSPTFLEISAQRGGQELFSNLNREVGRSDEDLQQAIVTATVDALIGGLKASSLDRPFAEFFDKVAADASTASKQAAIQVAQGVQAYTDEFGLFAGVFQKLATSSVEARNAMIQAAGGLDALRSVTGNYIESFYTQEERRDMTWRFLVQQFTELGQVLPSTAQGFRNLVDSLDPATQGEVIVRLQQLGPAFASLYGTLEETLQSAKSAAPDLKAVQDAFGVLRRSVDAERKQINGAFERQSKALLPQIDDLGKAVDKLSGLADALRGALSTFRTDPVLGISRAEAVGQIEAAIAIARASGSLPDAQSLQDALSVISRSDEQQYRTLAEFQRARDAEAGSLARLQELTKGQLTIEERTLKTLQDQLKAAEESRDAQLEYLDSVIESAQEQLDALNGVNTSVLSVRDAIVQVNAALIAAGGRPIPATPAPAPSSGGGMVGGVSTAGALDTLFQAYLGRAPDSGAVSFYQGWSDTQIAAAILNSDEYRRINGSNAAGLWTVPFDGYVSELHEGEAVLPMPMANAWRREVEGGGNAALAGKLDALAERLDNIADKLEAGNLNTSQAATILRAAAEGSQPLATEVA